MRGINAIFALFAAAATSVFAAPNGDPNCCGTPSCPSPCPPACPTGCLDDLTAKKLAATWLYFGVNIDRTLALELLAPNFTYYSDSENLVGLSGPNITTPGVPAYTSAFSFIRAMPTDQYSTGPLFPWGIRPVADPYIILDVFHSCDKIAIRWLYPFPNTPLTTPPTYTDIRGIDVLQVIPNTNGCGYQIASAWSEFDNVAYLISQGLCGQYCPAVGGG